MNYYFGQEQPDGGEPGGPDGFFRVFDTYVTYTATSDADAGRRRQLRHQRSRAGRPSLSLQGLGVYARYQVTGPSGSASARSGWTTRGSSAASIRCSRRSPRPLEYKFADGFLVRGEFRRDWSNEPFFTGPQAPAICEDHQNTRSVGAGVVVRQQEGCLVDAMLDVIFVVAIGVFFVAGAAYVAACRRLAVRRS